MLAGFPLPRLSPRTRQLIAVAMFASSLAALIAFGVLGLTLGANNEDLAVMHIAGRGWLAGEDPYQLQIRLHPEDRPTVFPYPPQSAFFFVPLALLDFTPATVVWLFVNVASIAIIVGLSLRQLRQIAPSTPTVAEALVVAALIIGNSFTTRTVWQGQTSIVVLAAVMAAWTLLPQRRVAAGVCLALAGFKPQGVLLFGLWLLLERQWRVLAVAAAATVAMSAYPFFTQGVGASLAAWWKTLGGYAQEGPNAPGFLYLVTLQSLLYRLGVQVPNLTLVAVLLTGVLWLFRSRIATDAVPGLLLALSATFISGHDQEYVWLIPLIVTLWARARDDVPRAVALGTLLVLLMVPLRILRMAQLESLYPWRTVLVLILMGLAVRWTWRGATRVGGGMRAAAVDPA